MARSAPAPRRSRRRARREQAQEAVAHERARSLLPGRGGLALAASAGAGAFVLSGALLTAGARIMARIPLVPQGDIRHRADARVRAVHPDRVHLDATAATERKGCLALRQGGGIAHVRLGPVTGRPTATTVSRPLLAQDTRAPLEPGKAWINGFHWGGTPRDAHGLATEHIEVRSPVGPMPAWLVPAPAASAASSPGAAPPPGAGAAAARSEDWAILIHGHGATRGEALRIIPLLHELGLTSLALTYRNDIGSPASADRMHHLGSAEWEDVEAGIEEALTRGARRIVLVGWSMGGGIALRTSVLSRHRERIASLVLDSPAVDWQDILIHHATALRAPAVMRRLSIWMMMSPLGARLVKLHEPLALHEMRPEFYARHLQVPTLLLHALEDTTVPVGPSRELARLRPDLVRFVGIDGASHTREWNRDPARTEREIADHLIRTLALPLRADELALPVRDPGAPPLPTSSGLRL